MTIARDTDIILAHGPELSAAGLDYYQLGLWAGGAPRCRVLALDPTLTPSDLLARLQAFRHHQDARPVVLAALAPSCRARVIRRILIDDLDLDPQLLAEVDLQLALDSPDPRACLLKAQNLILQAAAYISRAQPFPRRKVPVSTRILVWGHSFPALKAALNLAQLHYQVLLATPQATLTPLIPGASLFQPPPAELAAIIAQIREHPLIRLLLETELLHFQGGPGNYHLRLKTPQGVLVEKVGALILAPELELRPSPDFPDTHHPAVVSLSRLEEILDNPQETDAALPPTADTLILALLDVFSLQSHPLMLRRLLHSAAQLLARPNCQVHLILRDAKVAAPSLEAQMEAAQEAGLLVTKLNAPPAFNLNSGLPQLRYFDPVLRLPVTIACDLAVLAEAYGASSDNAHLAAQLGLIPGPEGFLQPHNVRYFTASTNRRAIYVIGPGRAIMDLDQGLAQADAAVTDLRNLLGPGLAFLSPGRAKVDRGRCVLCLTCYRLCPHGAITWDNRAVINELACYGCGLCTGACPQDAIQLHNFTDEQVTAVLNTVDYRLKPRIVAFMCQNSAWEAYLAALQLTNISLPLGFMPIKMPCAGKIDPDYLLQAFVRGAAGVLVLACHPDNCKSHQGNEQALARVQLVQDLLRDVGFNPSRLMFTTLAANTPQAFGAAVAELQHLISKIFKEDK